MTTEPLLTSVQAAEASGADVRVLDRWVAHGYVAPLVHGDRGRGKGHRFSLVQAVGLATAETLRKQPRGCRQGYVSDVVAAFTRLPELLLIAHLGQGDRYFVGVSEGGLPDLLSSKEDVPYWPDVQVIYTRVKAYCKSVHTV